MNPVQPTGKPSVPEEFRARQRRQKILAFGLFVVMTPVLVAIKLRRLSISWVIPIVVLILGAMVYSLKNWRCPACQKVLGRSWNYQICPAGKETLENR